MLFHSWNYRRGAGQRLTSVAVLVSAIFCYLTGSTSAAHADLRSSPHKKTSRVGASETRARLAYYMWYNMPAGSAINMDDEFLEGKIFEALVTKFFGQRLARLKEANQDFNLPFSCKPDE